MLMDAEEFREFFFFFPPNNQPNKKPEFRIDVR